MRKSQKLLLLAVVAVSIPAAAKDQEMQGTIVSENSVSCGTQAKGKKQMELMCQEYVIRTDTTEYHVRQEKAGHKEMLPMNAMAEMTIHKDRMKFKVSGKEYEMLVVSEAAAPPAAAKP